MSPLTPDPPFVASIRSSLVSSGVSGPRSSAQLAAAILNAADPKDLSPWIHFEPDRYTRNLVARGADWELRLLCWQPGQSSAMHGHGDAACAFRVLSGTATERRLNGPDRQLPAGTLAIAEPGELHQVGNESQEPLITLHLYSPPMPVDQPSSAEGHRIVIIGGGFSGAALAVHLLATGRPDLRLTLVERTAALGRGVAYGTKDAVHLLNVPAGRMSLDPRDPDAFLRFARRQGVEARPTDLLPRALYGDYVTASLTEAVLQHPGRLRVARGVAVAVEDGGVRLADGSLLPAADVVLATGHLPPQFPEGIGAEARGDHRVIADAWGINALDSVQPDDRVMVVGMGLTAVDVLLSLRARGLRGPVIATSRRGVWPLPHLPGIHWTGPAARLDLRLAPRTADGLFSWLRSSVREAAQLGVPWQAVIDAFRPQIPTIWAELPQSERARFLRRYKPWWEVHRHRAPIASLVSLVSWETTGQLSVVPGRIRACVPGPEGLRVTIDGKTEARVVEVDRLILCTGADTDLRRADNPVLRSLLMEGRVVADPLGLGLEVTADGRAIGANGEPDPRLWVLGAARRPRLWETTAVPELSRQAAALAGALVESGQIAAAAA